MSQTDPTAVRFTATDILRRAENLLARPAGPLVGFELTLPPASHVPGHGWAEVVATWSEDLPTVCEVVALGKALTELAPECRAVYTHADAGVLCHQVGTQFLFAPAALGSLPVL